MPTATRADHGARRPVIVLMSISSPWSWRVVEFLSGRGVPVHVLDLNVPSNGRGLDPVVHRFMDSSAGVIAGLHARPLPSSPALRIALGAHELRRLARTTGARAVVCLYGGLQATVAWLSGVRPFIVYVVGSDVLLAGRGRRFIARRAFTAATRIFANGAHLAQETRPLAGPTPVETLYLGIDLARFRPARKRTPHRTFVCSRAFDTVYDNGSIIRALSALGPLPSDVTFDFLSLGPLLEETKLLADRLLRSADRSRVVFHGGVTDEVLLAALQRSRFYVSASLSDGASASLLEAMACGCVPIVSDIPANRAWIQHGINGLLFAPGSASELRSCLSSALDGLPWHEDAVRHNLDLVHRLADAHRNLDHLVTTLDLLPGTATAPEGP